MKTKLLFFSFVTTLLLFNITTSSCNANPRDVTTDKQHDSDSCCVENNTAEEAEVEEQTADMKFLDVNGPIKTVTYKDEYNTDIYSYDRNGNLISVSYHGEKCVIKRNSKGQIKSLDYTHGEGEGDCRNYTYNSDGYIVKEEYVYGEINYIYTEKERPSSSVCTAEVYSKSKYEYTGIDSHGNWTKRIEKCVSDEWEGENKIVCTRTLQYY